MKALFRRTPDVNIADYTSSHQGRGSDYDENFDLLSARAFMWELEQSVLRELAVPLRPESILDFACGTGRIAEALACAVPGARIIGVDVAQSMLEVAGARVPDATFICADVRDLASVVPDESVDLVTAFRFFPNADSTLRSAAVPALARAVRPGGHIILNNHRNFWSPSYVARRSRSVGAPGAVNKRMVHPFLASGFVVSARLSLGVWPHSDHRVYGLSTAQGEHLEQWNRRHLATHHQAGTNTIWLLEKRR